MKLLSQYSRLFSTSRSCFNLTQHPLYRHIDPSSALGSYVIVDPMDAGSLLYLTERQYIKLNAVALSNEARLVVLMRPGEEYSPVADGKSSPSGGRAPSSSNQGDAQTPLGSVSNRPSANYRKAMVGFLGQFRYFPRSKLDFSTLVVTHRNVGRLLRRWGNILNYRLGGTDSVSYRSEFLQFSEVIVAHSLSRGMADTIKRLKVFHHTVVSYLAGKPHTDTRFLGIPIALANGLPKDLPVTVRDRIRSRNVHTIRVWLSLFSAYRALSADYAKPDLATISAPPFKDMNALEGVREYVSWFVQFLDTVYGPLKRPDLSEFDPHFTTKAGPNNGASIRGIPWDALGYHLHYKELENPLIKWCKHVGNTRLLKYYEQTLDAVLARGGLSYYQAYLIFRGDLKLSVAKQNHLKIVPLLGKLALKYEAAGKVRVFAIVDYFCQSALRPLHKFIFSLLKRLPSDATFDQEGQTRKFFEQPRTELYSFDLTAATDTLPIQLHKMVLSGFIGLDAAEIWGQLLVDRPFRVPKGTALKQRFIRYTRGQPMGALSSWGSLALTHHFLVFVASKRLGMSNYIDYLICGDDIIIGNGAVASSYQALCAEVGLTINNKGFISSQKEPVGEFVKQTYMGMTNISPLSLKEEIAIDTLSARVENILKLVRRGITSYTENNVLSRILRTALSTPKSYHALAKVLTSGRLSGEFQGLAASLVFPSPANLQAIGLKQGSFATWLMALQPKSQILNRQREVLEPCMDITPEVSYTAACLIKQLTPSTTVPSDHHRGYTSSKKVHKVFAMDNPVLEGEKKFYPPARAPITTADCDRLTTYVSYAPLNLSFGDFTAPARQLLEQVLIRQRAARVSMLMEQVNYLPEARLLREGSTTGAFTHVVFDLANVVPSKLREFFGSPDITDLNVCNTSIEFTTHEFLSALNSFRGDRPVPFTTYRKRTWKDFKDEIEVRFYTHTLNASLWRHMVPLLEQGAVPAVVQPVSKYSVPVDLEALGTVYVSSKMEWLEPTHLPTLFVERKEYGMVDRLIENFVLEVSGIPLPPSEGL